MDSTHNTLYINQRSYIEEVLRAHGFREEIPLSKEHAVFEVNGRRHTTHSSRSC